MTPSQFAAAFAAGVAAVAVVVGVIAALEITTRDYRASRANADRLVEELKTQERYCTELFKQDAAAADRCVTAYYIRQRPR